jgi:hypothetical protein
MPKSLIYSSDLNGHRQVYVFVIAHILEELGYKIYIACNTKILLPNTYYLDRLKKYPETEFIDTSKYSKSGMDISPAEFLKLQIEYQIDLTVFAEADHHISLFISQIGNKMNRFKGKVVGIFLRPFYFYEKMGLLDKLRSLKHLPLRWKKDDHLFHEFFLKRFSLISVALYIDENFVANHQYTSWIPDVFQEYADSLLQDERVDNRSWINKLEEFKHKNAGKFLFLYFGTAQSRRGYDILLNLAAENEGCFIHCGLRNNKEKYTYNVEELRCSLTKKGRLFETDHFIEDPRCIEYFFRSVSHLILPYRHFYGSSGVMLQALNFGIPVLAPENGIMGYRINKYKLGITYDDKNETNLKSKFDYFSNLDPKTFENDINSYMKYQSPSELKKALIQAFSNGGPSLSQPILQEK